MSRAHSSRRRSALPRPLPAPPPSVPASAGCLLNTGVDRRDELPLKNGLSFLRDAVTRFVRGGIYLLGGPPGGGKSLLSTQLALDLACAGSRSLFIMTEEAPSSLKERAMRLTGDWEQQDAARAMAGVQVEDKLFDVATFPSLLSHTVLSPKGQHYGVKFVVLDSIQGHGLAAAATRAYGKVLEGARMCADAGITVLLISHVTKRGEVAGPKALEHGVDATLVMRRSLLYSLLAVRKNRCGPSMLRPMPLTIDPVTTRLSLAAHAQALPGAARTFGGAGSGILQIQGSVTIPADGRRGRLTAPGLPKKEIEQLVECMSQIDQLDLSELDYRIQCRLPANGRYITSFGLPLCMSLIASYIRKTIPENNLYVGEVDLFRNVLPVPINVLQDLTAAIDTGEVATPVSLFVSPSAADHLPRSQGKVRVMPCRTLEDAIFQSWPDLR